MPGPAPTPDLIGDLAALAREVLDATGVGTAAVSWWDRDHDTLRTLVNVGRLHAGEHELPEDEAYPLDAFPAAARLLRFGRPYVDPRDVSSSALLAALDRRSQGAVPIVCDGEVWGELWAASADRDLGPEDLVALTACADGIGRRLASR
jgi:hypothetical protein